VNPPLTTAQIVENLVAKNLERAQALQAYQVNEKCGFKYKGLWGTRKAEMVLKVKYHSPGTKQFIIQNATGSKLVINKIFKRLLSAEEQVMGTETHRRSALNTDNYYFATAGFERGVSGSLYVLQVRPKRKDKFLYRGRIWVDAKDFAVVRLEAEPAKSPSFWVKKSHIEEVYEKVGDFWLPSRVHSLSTVRFGGHAELTIQYTGYQVTSADAAWKLTPPQGIARIRLLTVSAFVNRSRMGPR
jgi:hypothetical protein